MDPILLSVLLLAGLLALLFLGMHIAFAMALVGFVGVMLIGSPAVALKSLGLYPYGTSSQYTLVVIPLFVVMGHFAFHSGLSSGLYEAMYKWFGRLPCGLAVATVGACAAFATITGSSVVTAVTMGKVVLPEMKKYGYQDNLATGSVAAAGTLGILIPPSVPAVIYATITGNSTGQVLLAGFIPGVVLASAYALMLILRGVRSPSLGPRATGIKWADSFKAIKGAWQIVLVFGATVGGLYSGIFTPTEAGAAGAFITLILALASRKMGRRNFLNSLLETGQTTAMIFALLIGVQFFTLFVSLAGIPMLISEFIIGLQVPPLVILILILVLYIPLGMFFDGISMMLLTIPVFYPSLIALGFDGIWFGILLIVMIELGMITPPFAMNVYVVKSLVPDMSLEQLFKGIWPFVGVSLAVVALLVAIPGIVLWLPSTMR